MRKWLSHACMGVLAGSILGVSACGDDSGADDDNNQSDASIDGGRSDAGRDGGTDASRSLDSGLGSNGGARDAGPAYLCEPPPLPSGTIGKGAACCSGLGTCQERTADGGTDAFGDCNAQQNLRCVALSSGPDAGMRDGGTNAAPTCRMRVGDAGADYEGRCVPECLTRGASSSLTQGTCSSGALCVPCYSPVTGEDTGACRNGSDRPVEPKPQGYAECGDAKGYCISSSLIETTATLPQLSCPAGNVCAPKLQVLEPNSCFAHCNSGIGGPGACLPTFLVPDTSRTLLQQGECTMGELCTPCVNPLDQTRTGACD